MFSPEISQLFLTEPRASLSFRIWTEQRSLCDRCSPMPRLLWLVKSREKFRPNCTSSVIFSTSSVITMEDNNRITILNFILEFPLNPTRFFWICIFLAFCGYHLCSWWMPVFRIKKQVRTLLRLKPCWWGSYLSMKISTLLKVQHSLTPNSLSHFWMEKQNNSFC